MRNWTSGHILLVVLCMSVCFGIVFLVRNTIEIQEIRDAIIDHSSVSPSPVPQPLMHTDLVAQNEAQAGMPLSYLAQLIMRDEGKRSNVYLDPAGKPTVGVGRSLATNGLSLSELIVINPNPDLQAIVSSAEVRNGRIYLPGHCGST